MSVVKRGAGVVGEGFRLATGKTDICEGLGGRKRVIWRAGAQGGSWSSSWREEASWEQIPGGEPMTGGWCNSSRDLVNYFTRLCFYSQSCFQITWPRGVLPTGTVQNKYYLACLWGITRERIGAEKAVFTGEQLAGQGGEQQALIGHILIPMVDSRLLRLCVVSRKSVMTRASSLL